MTAGRTRRAGPTAEFVLRTVVEFAAAPKSVAAVRHRIAALAAAHGAAGFVLDDIRLAVGEAVANAVVHAGDEDEKVLIRVEASIDDGALNVVVADDGYGFRPHETAGLGLGLGIIAQCCADFAIGPSHPRGTEIRMLFFLTSPSRGAEPVRIERRTAGNRVAPGEASASRTRLIAAADEERQRIADDLHDGAQQRLVALAIRLAHVEDLLAHEHEDARRRVQAIREELGKALDEIVDLARGVYPSALATQGPAEALRAIAASAPIATTVTAYDLTRHSQDLERAVYFCCLEALQNAFKHADGATDISVVLHENTEGLALTVDDNGSGFDPSEVADGHGIANMADRLGALGGELTIDSERGRGTTVRGHVPLILTRTG